MTTRAKNETENKRYFWPLNQDQETLIKNFISGKERYTALEFANFLNTELPWAWEKLKKTPDEDFRKTHSRLRVWIKARGLPQWQKMKTRADSEEIRAVLSTN